MLQCTFVTSIETRPGNDGPSTLVPQEMPGIQTEAKQEAEATMYLYQDSLTSDFCPLQVCVNSGFGLTRVYPLHLLAYITTVIVLNSYIFNF